MFLRSQGALDLMLGRQDRGWSRLDLSADGFWNSFLAILVCVPALLVILISHARWLQSSGVEVGVGTVVASLLAVEFFNWIVTLLIVVALARPLRVGGRITHLVVALNWGSVTFAYLRAVPAALALVFGLGEGLAVMMLVLTVVTLVLYWRLLSAAAAPGPVAAMLFVVTVGFGYVLSTVSQDMLGIAPGTAN